MEMEMKRRSGNITANQKMILLDFMESHPKLMSGKFSATFTFRKSRELWQKLTELLNSSLGGAEKDWKQWRKTWQDIRSKAKSKQLRIWNHQNKTGGNERINEAMTDIETRVIGMIEAITVLGDTETSEYAASEILIKPSDELNHFLPDNLEDQQHELQQEHQPHKLQLKTIRKLPQQQNWTIRKLSLGHSETLESAASEILIKPANRINYMLCDNLKDQQSTQELFQHQCFDQHELQQDHQPQKQQLKTKRKLARQQQKLTIRKLASEIKLNKVMAERNILQKQYYKRKLELLEKSLVIKQEEMKIKMEVVDINKTIAYALETISDSMA